MVKNNHSSKVRVAWVDNLRAFAIFTVVIYHVVSMLSGKNLPGYDAFKGTIASFNMPIFFAISGYLSANKLVNTKHSLKDVFKTVKTWLLHLLLPAYVFTILIIPLDREVVHNPTIYFWFLHSLFRLYLIIYFANLGLSFFIRNKTHRFVLTIILAYIISYIVGNMSFEFTTYLLFGIIIKQKKIIDRINILHSLIFLLVGTLLVLEVWDHSMYEYKAKSLLASAPLMFLARQSCGISLSIAFIGIFKELYNNNTIFTALGTMTMGIYLIHDLLIEFVLNTYFKFCFNFSEVYHWGIVLIISVMIILVTSGLTLVIKKNKWSSLFLLGETIK